MWFKLLELNFNDFSLKKNVSLAWAVTPAHTSTPHSLHTLLDYSPQFSWCTDTDTPNLHYSTWFQLVLELHCSWHWLREILKLCSSKSLNWEKFITFLPFAINLNGIHLYLFCRYEDHPSDDKETATTDAAATSSGSSGGGGGSKKSK